MNRIRKGRIVALIIILILICVVPTILLVWMHIVHPQETAELNKEVEQQEEKIEAATTTVQAGDTYTVPKTGLYKIELHGGNGGSTTRFTGAKGSKVTGYVNLTEGEKLLTENHIGGEGLSSNYFVGDQYNGRGGDGLSLHLLDMDNDVLLGYVSGGYAASLYDIKHKACGRVDCSEVANIYFDFSNAKLFSEGDYINNCSWDKCIYEKTKSEYGKVTCTGCHLPMWSGEGIMIGGRGGSLVNKENSRLGKSSWEYSEIQGFSSEVNERESSATSEKAFMRLELVEHTLTIDPNGGTWNGSTTTNTSTMGTGATKTIANPTRTGYNFTGWTVTPNNVGSVVNGTTFTMGSADTTLTANWTPAQYTVTVNVGTGIQTVRGAGTYTYGQSVTVGADLKSNTPQYTYGWSNWTGTGIAGSNNQSYTFTMPAGNVTLTANGTQTTNQYLQTVRIRYQNADGSYGNYSNVINQNYNYGATVSWDTGQISGFDTNTYQSASLTSYTVTEAKTTDIDINRKTYDLTVNKGTGIASLAGANTGTYRVGQSITVSATPDRGYTWSKWTGTGVSDSNNQSYTFTMPSSEVNLTANATQNIYTITYDLAGGSVTGNPENYNVTTEAITLKNPTKTGYTFTGWTGSNGTTPQTTVTIAKGSTGDKTYTANWEASTGIAYTVKHWQENLPTEDIEKGQEKYTLVDTDNLMGTAEEVVTPETKAYEGFISPEKQNLTIAADGTAVLNYFYTRNSYKISVNKGTEAGIEQVTIEGKTTGEEERYLYGQEVTINAIVANGYTWREWIIGEENETNKITTKEYTFTIPAKNIEYTATAEINTYTITYELNGGTVEENPVNYTVETEDIILKKPTKTGYNFLGWTGSNGETSQTTVTIAKGSTGDKTYTANWEASTGIAYTVKHWQENLSTENNTENTNPNDVGAGPVSDQETNLENYTLAETENLAGTAGATITPETKEYEGFIAPEKQDLIIREDGKAVLNYYYSRRTDLIYTVNHIDKETGEIIKSKTIENQIYGSEINANDEVEEFENYNYDSLSPETLKIGTGENIINIYYVKKEGKIIVHHYIYDEEDDQYLNVKIVEDEEIEQEIGKQYETKPSDKKPANYECINDSPEGYIGITTQKPIEINYYYKLKTPKTEGKGSCNIITKLEKDENGNYIIKAGQEVEYEVIYEAKIDDYIGKATIEIKAELPKGTKIDLEKSDLNGGIYDEATNTITWKKEIENIDTFANGEYTEKITQNVKIVYAGDYVLKDANLKITGNIITYYPDDYPGKGGQILPNDNKNNTQGDGSEEKTGKVIVEYVDIDEPNNGAYRYEINDVVGKEYNTEEKEIPYYVLVRNTENTNGKIEEETQVVTYYYRKQDFNIGIEKTIDEINVNGENIEISNKEIAKIELKKEEIEKTELIVKYKIKVTNTGELEGTSKIQELIPEGYKLEYIPEYWNINVEGNLETKVNLGARESKELEVILRWENKEENLGTRMSTVKIEETENSANFKETNEKDNEGTVSIVIGIKTGETVSIVIIGMIMVALVICSYITIRTIRKKDPEIKYIKFLK